MAMLWIGLLFRAAYVLGVVENERQSMRVAVLV